MNQRLLELIEAFPNRHILLLGDFAADRYIYGKSSRLSREAPVIILRKTGETIVPGQAGNVATNIRALGGQVSCVGVVGRDEAGEALLTHLQRLGIDTRRMLRRRRNGTITKTRIYAGGHHAARQQVIRVDEDKEMTPTKAEEDRTVNFLKKNRRRFDAIVISDYGYGFISDAIWSAVQEICRKDNIPLAVDSRFNFKRFAGATVITPNESEAYAQMGLDLDQPVPIDWLGRKLMNAVKSRGVILTRGNEGMVVLEPRRRAQFIDIYGSDDITDVTGAGDTVIATVGLAIAGGATIVEAAHLANYAGGLVVMKPGTAQVSHQELKKALKSAASSGQNDI